MTTDIFSITSAWDVGTTAGTSIGAWYNGTASDHTATGHGWINQIFDQFPKLRDRYDKNGNRIDHRGKRIKQAKISISKSNSLTVPHITQPVDPRPPREFNRFLNASDLLEEFIKFARAEGVKPKDVFKLPIEYFIKWLILEACEFDGDDPVKENIQPVALPEAKKQPRCLGCQRYMAMEVLMHLHAGQCAKWYFARPETEVAGGKVGKV